MTTGFEVFNASSQRVFDATGRFPRVLGVAYADGTNPGSVQNAKFAQGQGFYSFQLAVLFQDVRAYKRHPVFAFSGDTLSWSYPAPRGTQYGVPGYIVYGVY